MPGPPSRMAGVLGLALLAVSPAEARRSVDPPIVLRGELAQVEREDARGAVRPETAQLRRWIDQAVRRRAAGDEDTVAVLLERCGAQVKLARARLVTARWLAEAATEETHLATLRSQIEEVKRSLGEALARKQALETGVR